MCVPPQIVGKKCIYGEYADQVLKTWEQRVKGNGQVTPIFQAAHVAAHLLDPMYAQGWNTPIAICLPVVPEEHEQMARDLIKRVGSHEAAAKFEQVRLEGYADYLNEPAHAYANTSVSVASVGSKRARARAVPLARHKRFWWRNGGRKQISYVVSGGMHDRVTSASLED